MEQVPAVIKIVLFIVTEIQIPDWVEPLRPEGCHHLQDLDLCQPPTIVGYSPAWAGMTLRIMSRMPAQITLVLDCTDSQLLKVIR